MRDTHERPVCHRAEDLVTYLYGEANPRDAFDFRNHLEKCDACRSEFSVFNQVHDSIQHWRTEALGASFDLAAVAEPAKETPQFVRHERRLSALAALREFFTVSPLWLRGATAFAVLLLLASGVFMLTRVSQKPVEVTQTGDKKIYTQKELETAVKKAVDQTRADLIVQQDQKTQIDSPETARKSVKRLQIADNQPKSVRPRGLNRQEREQLAADLRLTDIEDDDSLLAMPDQDNPNR
jgi:hypothetical protein